VEAADIKDFFGSQGFIVGSTSAEQFKALIDAEVPRWAGVIKAANIKLD
jgi:tripartite-type tricarboxylate transporter receptor subunit TctC